jgi:hypothetical protein
MTSIYTASTVVDVVDALPTLFGFELAESFVAIVTEGPRNRFGFRLRLDMPDVAGVDEAAQTIAQHLNEQRQNGVVLVALSVNQAAADALMAAVVARLSEAPIVLAVRADAANVWQYDRHGRPDYGAPVHERTQAVSVAVTMAVAQGQAIWSSREALAAMFTPAPVLDGISLAAVAVEAAGTTAVEELALAAAAALEASGPGTVSDVDARTLAIAAQIVPVRDAIWSTITPGTAEKDAEVWRQVAVKTASRAAAQESFVDGWQQAMWAGFAVMVVLFAYILVRGPRSTSAQVSNRASV